MKLDEAIRELSYMECKASIFNELLSVLSDIDSGTFEIVFRIPENIRAKAIKEVSGEIDKKRVEVLTEIEKLKKIEVNFGKKSSSKGKSSGTRSKKSTG